jgi:hypothetical protein
MWDVGSREAMHVCGRVDSLYLPFNFTVSLKLLLKIRLLKRLSNSPKTILPIRNRATLDKKHN